MRPLLAATATLAIGAPIAHGCAAQFDPPSKLNSLRVLAVVADQPYVRIDPVDPKPVTVNFEMTYHDGWVDPDDPSRVGGRPLSIVWIGPCVDPLGDQYYACYEQFAEAFANAGLIVPPDDGAGGEAGGPSELGCLEGIEIGGVKIKCGLSTLGDAARTFSVDIPADIVTRRPPPPEPAPHYGVAYVFFLVCAGTLGLVSDSADGRAGAFPIACFDSETGARLGAASFVPGYTQIYSFADPKDPNEPRITNENPVIRDLLLDGAPITDATRVPPCHVTEEDRRTPGCGKEDPFTACDPVEISIDVDPATVAEPDQNSETPDGERLLEAVWVDYFATGGDFEASVKLVSDPVEGFNSELGSRWIAPSKESLVTLYAVVRDARGGQAVISRELLVSSTPAPPAGGSGGAASAGGNGGVAGRNTGGGASSGGGAGSDGGG